MSPENRALDRLRRGGGAFGTTWEPEIPDEVVRRSMDYQWTLLGEHFRELWHLITRAAGHRRTR